MRHLASLTGANDGTTRWIRKIRCVSSDTVKHTAAVPTVSDASLKPNATSIRHLTLELLLWVLLLCIAGLRSVMPLINED